MDVDKGCCITHQQTHYAQLIQSSTDSEEIVKQLEDQAAKLQEAAREARKDLAEKREQEAAAAQQLVDSINNMRGAQFRLVPCDYAEKEKHKKFDHMVDNWDFVGLCDFFATHGMVFVANKKTEENKQCVFALLPVKNKVDYRASDIILSRVAHIFATRIFEAKHGMYNMMELRDNVTIGVPNRNANGSLGVTKNGGHFEPSQHCVHGCEFCHQIFKFDDNKHVYANLEVPVPDDEQPAKHRKTEENDTIHEHPLFSSTVAAQLRTHGRPRIVCSSVSSRKRVIDAK